MAWEFPAVSQTRVEFWKQPQFTKSGMWWFTLIFGFFGLHHLYLRSPQTAIIFLIANFFSLGFLWFYDLIQLSNVGESLENLNRHGLNTHLYNMGLAQGMWKEPESLMNSIGKMTGSTKDDDGPPNPFWFLLYCFIIPIAPLAQLVAADTNNAVSRFLDLTIIPLGFLFYLCAFIYDYMILLIWPADLFVAGSKRFFPFTYLGMDADGHSKRLTGVSEIKPCPADGFIVTMFRVSLPLLTFFFPGLGKSVTAALDTAQGTKQAVVDQGLAKVEQVSAVASKVGSLSTAATTTIPSAIAQASAKLNPQALMAQIPQVPQVPQIPQIPQMPQMPQVPQIPYIESTARDTKYLDATGKRFGTMVGGAQSFTPLDYAALGSLGAVIAGGFILSLNRNGKNDPPPNAGRV